MYTTDDLAALQRALASGELRVSFADGRSVEYRSIKEIKEAMSTVSATLGSETRTTPRVRQVNVNMDPGF